MTKGEVETIFIFLLPLVIAYLGLMFDNLLATMIGSIIIIILAIKTIINI
jgi:hypothetical protein